MAAPRRSRSIRDPYESLLQFWSRVSCTNRHNNAAMSRWILCWSPFALPDRWNCAPSAGICLNKWKYERGLWALKRTHLMNYIAIQNWWLLTRIDQCGNNEGDQRHDQNEAQDGGRSRAHLKPLSSDHKLKSVKSVFSNGNQILNCQSLKMVFSDFFSHAWQGHLSKRKSHPCKKNSLNTHFRGTMPIVCQAAYLGIWTSDSEDWEPSDHSSESRGRLTTNSGWSFISIVLEQPSTIEPRRSGNPDKYQFRKRRFALRFWRVPDGFLTLKIYSWKSLKIIDNDSLSSNAKQTTELNDCLSRGKRQTGLIELHVYWSITYMVAWVRNNFEGSLAGA